MDIVQKIETLLGRQALENLDFEALELAARKQVLQLAAKAIEQRLNADTSDEGGAHLRCRCGAAAKLIGRRSKTFHSVLGPLRLQRAYYYCAACGHGHFPRDRQLGMEKSSLSPAVTRMTGTVGAMVMQLCFATQSRGLLGPVRCLAILVKPRGDEPMAVALHQTT